jgi:hypothetical protein
MKNKSILVAIIAMTFSMLSSSFAQVRFTEKAGGESGKSFILPSTRQAILSNQGIKRIAVQHNSRRVEQIVMEYSTNEIESKIDSIGNDSGEWNIFELEEGEYIVYVTGRAGTLIDQVSFHTTQRRTFGPFGGSGGQPFDLSIPSNAIVIGLFGKAGPSIHQLGLIYRVMNADTSNSKEPKSRIRDHRNKEKSDFQKYRVNVSPYKSSYIDISKHSKNWNTEKIIHSKLD